MIPWEKLDLVSSIWSRRLRANFWKDTARAGHISMGPIESGRGCPNGLRVLHRTGLLGDSIRFRTQRKRCGKMLRLKERAHSHRVKLGSLYRATILAII